MKLVLTASGPDGYLEWEKEIPAEKVEELKPHLGEADPPIYGVPDEWRDRVGLMVGMVLDPELTYLIVVIE